MMRLAARVTALTGLLLLGACSSIQVSSDYDSEADFQAMRTWAWMPEPEAAAGERRLDDPFLYARIRRAVEVQLRERGYPQVATEDADFLVGYHVTLDTKTSVVVLNTYYGYRPGWGYRYGYAYRPGDWRVAPETYVYEYEEGTLILDIVEPGTRKLLWRGAARDEVNFQRRRDAKEARINEAVKRMLDRFPPAATR